MIRLDRVSLPTVISGRHRRRSRQPQRHKDTKTLRPLVILSGLGVVVVHALMTKPTTYREAGVNIDAANRATEKIKELARATFNARTLSEIGSFGGMFDGAFPEMRQPVLIASADGVGTKLKIAFATGIHNTIGRDLVNHCVNDILVQGARPLFFLDYIATGKLSPDVVAGIVEGIANGCGENGCVLLGGETAEMPDFYSAGEYDVAGVIVGIGD